MPQNDKAKGVAKYHGITSGTAAASKALVVDANRDIANIRNISATSFSTSTGGDVTVGGNLVMGTTSPVTLSKAELGVLDAITPGTAVASKAVVLDANRDVNGIRNIGIDGVFLTGSTILSEAELKLLDGVSAGTVTASRALSVNSSRDVSTLRNITTDGTLTFNAGGAINADTSTATASAGFATLNKMAGKVTTNTMLTSPLNSFTLTVGNSTVAASDLIFASIGNFSTAGIPILIGATPSAGTITFTIFNADTVNSFNGTVVVSFLVIKA